MKKILWIIAVLTVVGYFANSYIENKAKREAEQAQAKRIEQATKSAVAEMVARTAAIDDWEARLSKGETYRIGPILTVELEKLWLQERPILFIGAIKDIATHDQLQYTVLVERGLFGEFKYMFDTELQLSLLSSKEKIDSFLKKYPDLFTDYGFNNGVAVIARINAIRTIHVSGEEGEPWEIKIGDGELVDIVYLGDVSFDLTPEP